MTELHQPDRNDAGDAESEPDAGEPEAQGNPIRLAILTGLIVLMGLLGGWPLLVVVLGVVVMIFLHELGHFMAAKVGGMKVTEFFIGFGPRIWSFRRGETEYGLKAIPAGAYVKVIGMTSLEEVDATDEDRTYRVKSYPKRMLVAVAGSGMHFAQALVLMWILFAFVGVPGGSLVEADRAWEVEEVLDGSAADDAGLQAGDKVVAVDGETMDSFTELRETIVELGGENVILDVERGGDTIEIPVSVGLADGTENVGQLGVASETVTVTVGPVEAVGASLREFGTQTTATLGFFGEFLSPSGIGDFADKVARGSDDSVTDEVTTRSGQTVTRETPDEGRVMSIVGAVHFGTVLTENGMLGFLAFFVAINVAIGVFNLLPVLPLDGGHVVIATYERIREFFLPRGQRYYTDFAKVVPIVYAAVFALVLLGLSTIYLDLIDPPI